MKKVILVDGNNLMFRSYYATAYNGNLMKNSKDFPTNALYGFVNMINKIINEEKPIYIAVAFDIGKNFRHDKYDSYKAGRIETPTELKQQMPIARKILTAMGIKYLELEPYEADDIIGTLAKMADEDPEYDATIISSDKDLLQLISDVVDVKLLKQKDYIRYNHATFVADYGIEPIRIIDLKGLAGDSSDNIPGVKGIGEKTALTLLQKYDSVEGIYEHIDEIKGKMQEKLINDRDNAFMSKDIATIYRDVPLNITFEDIKYQGADYNSLYDIYRELEFYSMIKDNVEEKEITGVEFKEIKSVNEIEECDEYAFYIECSEENYHKAEILGMSVSTKNNNYFVNKELVKDVIEKIKDKTLYTYDFKKDFVLLKRLDIDLKKVNFDLMIALYLLNYNVKDDIAYIMNSKGYKIAFYDKLLKEGNIKGSLVLKSRYIFDSRDDFVLELKKEDMYELFKNIEMPLIRVLGKMEYAGIKLDSSILEEMSKEIKIKLTEIEKEVYDLAGEEFNISSPKQLGVILFEKLGLPYGKKSGSGQYKTDVKVLHKLVGKHPIIELILEYRNYAKLCSTYLDGLVANIFPDGKIHTIYKQTLTRTGRLSSVEPNMQNIPTRDEEGRRIRKAFLPVNDLFFSADYSQIELRVLAHIAGENELMKAFINGTDIHTKVAADIYGVPEEEVTKKMRRNAKAVIFGIVYGISGFGLGENLELSVNEARELINKYYELYPKVKKYMDEIVEEAYVDGCVRTLYNRKRVIDELSNKNYMIRQMGERIALNTPIQGTAADIIKMAMIKIDKEFEENNLKSKMLLQVHDELVFDVVLEEKDKVNEIVTNCMENVVKLSVPLKVSHDFGTDWYEAK